MAKLTTLKGFEKILPDFSLENRETCPQKVPGPDFSKYTEQDIKNFADEYEKFLDQMDEFNDEMGASR